MWFVVDHKQKPKKIINSHLNGVSIRKIADDLNISKSSVLRKYITNLKELPHNNEITKKYCNRFCGILIVDGKYIKVKGFKQKIPLLYGIDYLSHDIPIYLLNNSESYEGWLKYFGYLKSIKYPMQILICDDNENIKSSAKYIFPNVLIQTCQKHFIDGIRRDLQTRTNEKYKTFVSDIKKELFLNKITRMDFQKKAFKLFEKYLDKEIEKRYLLKIERYFEELTASSLIQNAPRTTNLIELYNSHLEARLKSIKGFKSFKSANKWLNAYILKRRFTNFKSCSKKFKHLNGKSSIYLSKIKHIKLPDLF